MHYCLLGFYALCRKTLLAYLKRGNFSSALSEFVEQQKSQLAVVSSRCRSWCRCQSRFLLFLEPPRSSGVARILLCSGVFDVLSCRSFPVDTIRSITSRLPLRLDRLVCAFLQDTPSGRCGAFGHSAAFSIGIVTDWHLPIRRLSSPPPLVYFPSLNCHICSRSILNDIAFNPSPIRSDFRVHCIVVRSDLMSAVQNSCERS